MKKSTTTRFRISDIIIIIFAFVGGALLYFLSAVGIDKITPAAGAAGAFQQVTVKVNACNCITEFEPNPMLPGNGVQNDPYISNNMRVNIAFKANGVGKITIEDENGNVLYVFAQTNSNEPEHIIPIVFPSAGDHKLIIKIDGDEYAINGVSTELYFRIGKLPPIIPDIPGVPSTGSYIYIAGYAVQTYSLLASGIIVAVIAAILLFFVRRRQHRDETKVKVVTKTPTKRGKKPKSTKSSPSKTTTKKRR